MSIKVYDNLAYKCCNPHELVGSDYFFTSIKKIITHNNLQGKYDYKVISTILNNALYGIKKVSDGDKKIIEDFFTDEVIKKEIKIILNILLKSIIENDEFNNLPYFLQNIFAEENYYGICQCVGEVTKITNLIMEKYQGYERIEINPNISNILSTIEIDLIDFEEEGISEIDEAMLSIIKNKKIDNEKKFKILKKLLNEKKNFHNNDEIYVLWNEEEGRIFRDDSWEKQELPYGDGYRLYYVHPELIAIEDMNGNQIISDEIKEQLMGRKNDDEKGILDDLLYCKGEGENEFDVNKLNEFLQGKNQN